MTARDEAISAMIDAPFGASYGDQLDAIPSDVMLRVLIERGHLEESGAHVPPLPSQGVVVYHHEDAIPADAEPLYRVVES